MLRILLQDVKYLKGVGPVRAKMLGDDLKVFTVRDLLYTFPYKYIDRTVVHAIRDLREDMPYVQLVGQLTDLAAEGEGRKRRLKAIFTDGTGYVDLVWFNAIRQTEAHLKFNCRYLLFGRPTVFNGRISFAHPEMEPCSAGGIQSALSLQAHYHTSEKMKRVLFTSRALAALVRAAFNLVGDDAPPETLPEYIRSEYQLMPLAEALRTLHFPASAEALPPARRRLKFDELFYLQLDLLRYAKNRRLGYAGFLFPHVGKIFNTFYAGHLPFPLTNAQKRVVREIRRDFATGRQMNRLLQGDVGSGKTLVALMAALIAIDNGYQACLMAPTEILAEQHLATLRGFLGNMPLRVELLTGNVTGATRREVLAGTADGSVNILVGTHALIEPAVKFRNLGLAVIDEQHRFGVRQRARLWQKNVNPPHILVMTATPIPRTLAMTLYGDLDVSVIDELPPGRKPVQTLHYTEADTASLYDGLRRQLKEGRQAYVVFPLIEGSEKTDLQDLENGFARFSAAFPDFRIGKVHGRMRPAEKESAMADFAARRTQILVATTVIEVGVNVPNATVMVIENAERFGLSQLHQLRGRVGRGADRSYCILVTRSRLSDVTTRRIGIMTETTDGFRLAEEDMRLRGPGSLQGTEQSGLPFELKVADIVQDAELMAVCRSAARQLIDADPYENLSQNRIVWEHLRFLNSDRKDFSAIS